MEKQDPKQELLKVLGKRASTQDGALNPKNQPLKSKNKDF